MTSRQNEDRFVKLSVNYEDDPRIIEAGEAAELLFVRAIAYAGRLRSDGRLTDAQLARFRLRSVAKRAAKLVEVGLFVREPDGYRITNYTKWNETAEEIKAKRQASAERKRQSRRRLAEAGHAPVTRDRADVSHRKTETETETETEKRSTALVLAHEPSAGTLVAEWIDRTGQQPKRVVGQVSKELRQMLDEGIPYERVRAGLAEWARSTTHPSTLASFVSRAGQPRNGSRPASTTDKRVTGTLALAERLEREGQ